MKIISEHNENTMVIIQENIKGNVIKFNIKQTKEILTAIGMLIGTETPFNITYMN